MSLTWNAVANLVGPSGLSTLSGSGAPANTLGNVGDIYVDTLNARLYPAKTATGWQTSYQSLVGPVTQQVLPSDLAANSLVLAPVANDSNATALVLQNSTGTQFQIDGNGNLTGNTATVTALTSSGVASASTVVSAPGSLSHPAFTFNNQIDSGVYLPTASANAAVMALVVNATQALALTSSGASIPGTLTVAGQTALGAVSTGALTAASFINTGSGTAAGYFSSIAGQASAPSFSFTAQKDTGAYLAATSASAAILALAVNGVQALALSKAGASVPGTLSVAGASTLAALTAASASVATLTASGAGSFGGLLTVPSLTLSGSGGLITFPDGTTQATAANAANNVFAAGSNGTAVAPAFTFSSQTDTGQYLATASSSAAVLGFSVNATQALALSKTGATIPGTLTVGGATNFGATTLSSLNVTGNAQVQGTTTLAALSVTSLTNSGTTTSLGHTVSSNGSAAAPSYSFVAQPDTGMYLPTASATAAVLGFSANGILALNVIKGGITVPGTLGVSGASTLAAISGTTLALSSNETIAGTSTITGLLTASGNISTPLIATTQVPSSKSVNATGYNVSNVTLPGTFGDGNNYPASGLSSDSLGNILINYQGVPFIRSSNPGYSSATGNSPNTAFVTAFSSGSYTFSGGGNTLLALSSTTAKYGFNANTVPFTMQALSGSILVLQNGGTAPNYTTTTVGTVSSAGLATFTGISLTTSTGLTFADNTVQTTAFNATSAGQLSKFTATSNGTTALPAFTFSNNTDTGAYLKTASASAAVLSLSVNASDALTLSKTGASVPGTLTVTGALTASATLTVTGSASTGALSATGLITAPNITLGTSGKLTFGDGTSLTTAALGSSPTYTASGGSLATPAFSFTANTDSGLYLKTSSTSAAVTSMSVNGTDSMTWSKTGVTIPGAFGATGTATFAGAVVAASATINGNIVASAGGSATSPVINLSGSSPGSGIWYSTSTPVGINFTLAGTTQLSLQSGIASFNGSVQGQYIRATNGSASSPAISNQSGGSTGMYFPTVNSWALIAGASGSGVVQVQGTGTALTLSTPVTVQSTMATQGTVTSSTAAGTPSFVSTQGFKAIVEGSYWRTSYAANAVWTVTRTQFDTNAGTSAASDLHFGCTFAGSVVGLCLVQYGSSTGTSTLNVIKNGSSSNLISWSPGTNNTGVPYTISYAKGTYAFAANDVLTFTTSNSAAGEIKIEMWAYIEMGA
jgi:hypothetical protein